MLEAALITFMVMAGAALISYFTAVQMTDYIRQGEDRKLYQDFTWLAACPRNTTGESVGV